jgi:hypothetical protein
MERIKMNGFSKTLLVFACLAIFAFSACDKQSGLLIGQVPGSRVQKVTPASLISKYFNFIDSTVITEVVYHDQSQYTPKEGYLFVETRNAFGSLWILVNDQRYGKLVKRLKQGDIFKVCGQVTAVGLQNKKTAKITIQID